MLNLDTAEPRTMQLLQSLTTILQKVKMSYFVQILLLLSAPIAAVLVRLRTINTF